MLPRSFQIDRDRVRFRLAGVFDGVRDRIAPNGLSGRSSFLFCPAVWITELDSPPPHHIHDAGEMGMLGLFSARLESILEDAPDHFRARPCNIAVTFSPGL